MKRLSISPNGSGVEPMLALMELFLVPSVRLLGWLIPGEVVAFFILRKLGMVPVEALMLPVFGGGFAYLIFVVTMFSKNISWLLGLPLSKKQLICVHYASTAGLLLLGRWGSLRSRCSLSQSHSRCPLLRCSPSLGMGFSGSPTADYLTCACCFSWRCQVTRFACRSWRIRVERLPV